MIVGFLGVWIGIEEAETETGTGIEILGIVHRLEGHRLDTDLDLEKEGEVLDMTTEEGMTIFSAETALVIGIEVPEIGRLVLDLVDLMICDHLICLEGRKKIIEGLRELGNLRGGLMIGKGMKSIPNVEGKILEIDMIVLCRRIQGICHRRRRLVLVQ